MLATLESRKDTIEYTVVPWLHCTYNCLNCSVSNCSYSAIMPHTHTAPQAAYSWHCKPPVGLCSTASTSFRRTFVIHPTKSQWSANSNSRPQKILKEVQTVISYGRAWFDLTGMLSHWTIKTVEQDWLPSFSNPASYILIVSAVLLNGQLDVLMWATQILWFMIFQP